MPIRRAYDLDEARRLCARLAARCDDGHCRDHILACRRARDLKGAQRHLAWAFAIAAKEGAVTADDWRAWKRELKLRRYRSKSLPQAEILRQSQAERILKGEIGGLATERFRVPAHLRAADRR